jgi:hypothetical protein
MFTFCLVTLWLGGGEVARIRRYFYMCPLDYAKWATLCGLLNSSWARCSNGRPLEEEGTLIVSSASPYFLSCCFSVFVFKILRHCFYFLMYVVYMKKYSDYEKQKSWDLDGCACCQPPWLWESDFWSAICMYVCDTNNWTFGQILFLFNILRHYTLLVTAWWIRTF